MSLTNVAAMQTCSCGNPIKVGERSCPRCVALRVLDLGPNAGEEEIRNAHRVMVKVWHPDRFQGDARLRAAAEAKLKDVNAAYELLTSPTWYNPGWSSPNVGARPANPQRSAQSVNPRQNKKPARQNARKSGFTSAQIYSGLKLAFGCLLGVFALLLCRYLWIAFDVRNTTNEAANTVIDFGKDALGIQLEAPRRRFLAAIEDDLERLRIRKPAPQPTVILQAGSGPQLNSNARSGRTAATSSTARKEPSSQTAPRRVYSYITVGSTRDEVVNQVGPPTESTPSKLVYGRSELYLKDNSVIGWHIDPVASPIRVKLWPSASVDPTLDSFTVGSSRDLVLVVQGTPTAFSEDKFEYGGSVVNFQNWRVVSWKSDPGSIPLRAR